MISFDLCFKKTVLAVEQRTGGKQVSAEAGEGWTKPAGILNLDLPASGTVRNESFQSPSWWHFGYSGPDRLRPGATATVQRETVVAVAGPGCWPRPGDGLHALSKTPSGFTGRATEGEGVAGRRAGPRVEAATGAVLSGRGRPGLPVKGPGPHRPAEGLSVRPREGTHSPGPEWRKETAEGAKRRKGRPLAARTGRHTGPEVGDRDEGRCGRRGAAEEKTGSVTALLKCVAFS